mgnify:CR=1 FL=1
MLHKPENYVNKADFIFGVFDIWILHRYDFLNFVKEHIIILAVVGGFLTEVLSQFNRISVPDIFDFIKCQFNDLIVAYALRFQMILVNIEQQVGFTAAAYSGYYLYHAVIFSADKLVKVLLAFYHRFTPLSAKMRIDTIISILLYHAQGQKSIYIDDFLSIKMRIYTQIS